MQLRQYLHAKWFPVLLAAVYELLQSISVLGLLVRFLHLLLDVLLDLGVYKIPCLDTLENIENNRKVRDRCRKGGKGRAVHTYIQILCCQS